MTKLNISPSLLERLKRFERLYVGFSGGVDSTVLLHFLSRQDEFKSRLTAIHIHHGISPDADQWVLHCQQVCQQLNLPFISRRIKLETLSNVEEQARLLRFDAFQQCLNANDALLLAQHLDDQVETVLFRLFRGTGVKGAAAMAAERSLPQGELIRPLLNCTRQDLLNYANEWRLSWVEDESNGSLDYDRNYLRNEIMPLIKQRWPAALANIARFSSHCRETEALLDEFCGLEHAEMDLTQTFFDVRRIERLSHQRQKLLLRQWLSYHHPYSPSSALLQRIFSELIGAKEDAGPLIQWGHIQLRRYQNKIYLWRAPECLPSVWEAFPQPLTLSSGRLEAKKNKDGFKMTKGKRIEIRFREGGERFFYRGQHKQLKKLFQDWGVPPWLRDCWPLVYVDEQLAVIPDYAVSDDFYSSEGDSWKINYQCDVCFTPLKSGTIGPSNSQ